MTGVQTCALPILKICLKTYAKQAGSQTVVVRLQDRKPASIGSEVELTCVFNVEARSDYYLLTLDVSGQLMVACLRCLGDFDHEYKNTTQLAICANEEIAETLMASYECIVANNSQIDLIDIVADELYLFVPEKHADIAECDREISGLIGDII